MKKIIENLSDEELLELLKEYRLQQIAEDSIVRKVVIECFGEINILPLQMNQLLWSIVEVLEERFIYYKNNINNGYLQ